MTDLEQAIRVAKAITISGAPLAFERSELLQMAKALVELDQMIEKGIVLYSVPNTKMWIPTRLDGHTHKSLNIMIEELKDV